MRVMVGLMVLLLLLVSVALPGPASAKPAGDKAFLIDSVDSVEGLVRQVEDSRLLALRYAKFFKVDPSSVVTYFRDLSIAEVKETTSLDVYHRKGLSDVESERKQFKKGTKVFVNRNGIPILELGTGNPLADILPGKDVKELPKKAAAETSSQPATANNTPTTQPTTQPTTAQPTAAQPTAPAPGTPELPNTVPGTETSPLSNPTTVASTAGTTEPETAVLASGPIETIGKVASKSVLSGWIVPVGLAGAAAALAGGGGGGGTSSNNEGPTPVPEPAGLLALSTGLIALTGTAYRLRRR